MANPDLQARITAAVTDTAEGTGESIIDPPTFARVLLGRLAADNLTITQAPPGLPSGPFDIRTAERQPVILHALGVVAALMHPNDELALILDIAGRRNQPPSAGDYSGSGELVEERILLAPGQAGELIAALSRAAAMAGPGATAALLAATK